jgi:pyruvate formate lyase activating enzyme
MDIVLRDRNYYRRTGGGMTLSGGEPLMQPRFSEALLSEARRKGIHTALDTAGCSDWEPLAALVRHADLVLFDLKHIDRDAHQKETGRTNEIILNNLEQVLESTDARVWVRYPVIPGFNDSDDSIEAACRFIGVLPRRIEKISLLPFHNLAAAKYIGRGAANVCENLSQPTPERLDACRLLVERHGFRAQVGR